MAFKLAPHLDAELKRFYCSLLRSEARHFHDYLKLAQSVSAEDITPRVDFFLEQEALLITTEDPKFRFHSGIFVNN